MKIAELILSYGLFFGALSFLGGLFLPLIFHPEANQGPLAAFFVAPVGFVVGCLIGAVYAIVRGRI